ncbi:HNH endonuclease [Thauera sp.]|uniref:HNH endonuclease n=1 Tax=Thauera sp. TaxID=1905334 RepID=UPI002CB21D70|nr:HNH endonuclease [Thauera sp.]HRP25376.1 HNH endonuclease [Thauera sp.]
MPAKRKDEQAARMAAAYLSGLSLAEVAQMFGVTRQSVHRMLARRDVPMRQATPRPAVIRGGVKYTQRPNGYYARTTGAREYLHRDVWEDTNGPLPPGFDVHHVDEDKANCAPSNLDAHTRSEHGRRHGFGGNQYVPSLGRRPGKW